MKSWKKSSPGAWAERTYFLVHGDGGTEEDEEGGSQKGEAQVSIPSDRSHSIR